VGYFADMPFALDHTTPKCTTDSCRSMRNITHLTFETFEQAQAFIRAHQLSNITVRQIHVEHTRDRFDAGDHNSIDPTARTRT
jgi:hypothetical protein